MRCPVLPLLATLVALFAAAPALALQVPHGGHADLRVRTVDYDPTQVVRLAAAARTATEVQFAPDEAIQHVALGDTSAWDVAADGHLLFLKPKAKAKPTNLIVTTTRGAATRSYYFELSAATARRQAYFALRFRYPLDERVTAHAALGASAAALDGRISGLELERGAVEGARNLAWSLQGPAELAPSEVSDNGRFTVLRFPGAQALPAIYTVAPDGTEALAPTDVRGDFVVVHGAWPGLRLRRGHGVACLFNEAWRPAAALPATHTAAREVVRTDPGAPR